MQQKALCLLLIFVSTSSALDLTCYKCDGIKGSDLPCDGDRNLGREVTCRAGQKCGVLHELRKNLDNHHTVVSTESRWRRDCATDGYELTDESEADPGTLTGELGCVDVHGRTENKVIIENTLCLCNTTLCNQTDQNGAFNPTPTLVTLVLTLALTCLYNY